MNAVGMTPEAVAAVGAAVTGHLVERVELLAGSVGNHDFMLATRVGDFVLKASLIQDLVAEAWACERARRKEVFAPEIICWRLRRTAYPCHF